MIGSLAVYAMVTEVVDFWLDKCSDHSLGSGLFDLGKVISHMGHYQIYDRISSSMSLWWLRLFDFWLDKCYDHNLGSGQFDLCKVISYMGHY